MQRRALLCCFALIAGCGAPPKSLGEILPESAGEWRRDAVRPAAQIPDQIARMGVAEAAETTYRGKGSVHVRAFRMKAPASAFELMQQWRQTEGAAGYEGPFFFVTRSEDADPGEVAVLLRRLQEAAR